MNNLIPLTRIFDAALNTNLDRDLGANWTLSPRADILEGEKEFQIVIDMPGVKTEGLEIELENQTLRIKATRENVTPQGFETLRRERPGNTSFVRSFTLGTAVDSSQISARLDDGVLMMTLPKNEKSLLRRIEVK